MFMKNKILFAILPVLLAVGLVNAETYINNCTTINSPGHYILTTDLDSGNAECISIESSDVILDLNGHTLSNDGVSSPVLFLISGNNITVENGTIISGINVENVSNVLFKNLYINLKDFLFYIDHEETRHNITLDTVTIVTDWGTYGGHLWFKNVDGLYIKNSYIDRIESCGNANNVYIENTVVNFRNITDVQGSPLQIEDWCGTYNNVNINNVVVYSDQANWPVVLKSVDGGNVNNLNIFVYEKGINIWDSDDITINGATILYAKTAIESNTDPLSRNDGIDIENVYVKGLDDVSYAERMYQYGAYGCKYYYDGNYGGNVISLLNTRNVYMHNITVENAPNERTFSIYFNTSNVLLDGFTVKNANLVAWGDRLFDEVGYNQNVTIRNGYAENVLDLGIAEGTNGWTVENIVFNNSCAGVFIQMAQKPVLNAVVRNITMYEGFNPVYIYMSGATDDYDNNIRISDVTAHHSYRLFRISGSNSNLKDVSFSNGECYQCDQGVLFGIYGNLHVYDVNISSVYLDLNTSADNIAVVYLGYGNDNIVQNVHMWDNILASDSTLHSYQLYDNNSYLALINVARFDSDSPEHYYQLSVDPQNYTAKIQVGSSVSFNVDAYLDTNLLNVTYYINGTDISGAENISKDNIHVVVNGNEYNLSQPVAVNTFEFDGLHNNQIPITVKLPVFNKVGVYEGKVGIKVNPYAEVNYSIEVKESFVQKSVSLMFAAAGFMSIASIIIMIMNSSMSSLKDIVNMVLYIILISSVVGILFSMV